MSSRNLLLKDCFAVRIYYSSFLFSLRKPVWCLGQLLNNSFHHHPSILQFLDNCHKNRSSVVSILSPGYSWSIWVMSGRSMFLHTPDKRVTSAEDQSPLTTTAASSNKWVPGTCCTKIALQFASIIHNSCSLLFLFFSQENLSGAWRSCWIIPSSPYQIFFAISKNCQRQCCI